MTGIVDKGAHSRIWKLKLPRTGRSAAGAELI